MKARLLKRPEITQPPAPTQPLPPAQNPKPTVEEDSPDELSMIAELKDRAEEEAGAVHFNWPGMIMRSHIDEISNFEQ